MSYPFGFNLNSQWFFFRSVFFPAVLLICAVLVASYSTTGAFSARWYSSSTAIFFSALPMLYDFEMNPLTPAPATWGLVDGFLTGCAAFSIACAWRSVGHRSPDHRWLWYLLAGLSAAFCITIKPSGVVVAALVGVEWALLSFFCLLLPEKNPSSRKALLSELLCGGMLIAAPVLATLWMARTSAYLSVANFAVGRANIAVMKTDLTLGFGQFLWLVHHNIGEALLIWLGVAIYTAVSKRKAQRGFGVSAVTAMIAVLTLAFGVWFWLVGTGGATQMRYGMPFIMMGMVLLVAALRPLWPDMWVPLQQLVKALCIIASANLACLLFAPIPSVLWQNIAGVSVTAPRITGVQRALEALANIQHQNGDYLYSIPVNFQYELANSILQQWWLLNPHKIPLGILLPVTWLHPASFNLADIAVARYILSDNAVPQPLISQRLGSFRDETTAMTQWADMLTPQDGIVVVYTGGDGRILRVVDHEKFAQSLRQFVAAHEWRPQFYAVNKAFLRRAVSSSS
jgi:hypothetical protein